MAYTTIDDPSAHFQTKIYTGNGTDSTAYTFDGISSMQPDLLWFKSRSIAEHHMWIDSTRGVSNKWLGSSDEGAEGAATQGYIESFDSDGWTSKDGTSGSNPNKNNNQNTVTYVTWGWKANGGTTETAVDESGDNPANVRQTNATAGFSIITSTGTGGAGTIAHGLGAVPHWIISKGISNDGGWVVYHQGNTSEPETDALNLANATATYDAATWWNDTAPTSSVFTLGTTNDVNGDARTYVHYVFTPIQGYSKFGSYTGNGDADGPFVYTGFKPAWTMIKRSDTSNDGWYIHDSTRSPFNQIDKAVKANLTSAEGGEIIDYVSNGFKQRIGANANFNADGGTYIYMAFAEEPFVTSGGVPATAR